jgi:hypothetical protein
MKIGLPRFGFCGIVAKGSQSCKDTTIIGWFTTMTMLSSQNRRVVDDEDTDDTGRKLEDENK